LPVSALTFICIGLPCKCHCLDGANKSLTNALTERSTPISILLVEDDPYDTLLILEALADRQQFHVRAVEDGAQALAYLQGQYLALNDQLPDLLIMDLRLPKMNGLELLAEIKTDERLKPIPVIILTNSTFDQDIRDCYALHANVYIQKPFSPVLFRKVIRQTLDFWLNIATLPHP
jgi:two-component system, chemotaxis family, response regulator Rcp1